MAWLCVWLVGQVLCVHHCGTRILGASAAQGCCAKKAASDASMVPHAPSTPPASDASWSCTDSKSLKTEPGLSGWTAPSSAWALLPAVDSLWGLVGSALPVALRPPADAAPPAGALGRTDWVFPPAVSLGAACRSLAPPAPARA